MAVDVGAAGAGADDGAAVLMTPAVVAAAERTYSAVVEAISVALELAAVGF